MITHHSPNAIFSDLQYLSNVSYHPLARRESFFLAFPAFFSACSYSREKRDATGNLHLTSTVSCKILMYCTHNVNQVYILVIVLWEMMCAYASDMCGAGGGGLRSQCVYRVNIHIAGKMELAVLTQKETCLPSTLQ